MKIDEIRKKSTKELKDELLGLMKEQFSLRIRRGADEVSRPHRYKQLRRDIARIKTILSEKAGAS